MNIEHIFILVLVAIAASLLVGYIRILKRHFSFVYETQNFEAGILEVIKEQNKRIEKFDNDIDGKFDRLEERIERRLAELRETIKENR